MSFQLHIMADPLLAKVKRFQYFEVNHIETLILTPYQQNQHIFSSNKRGIESTLIKFMGLEEIHAFLFFPFVPLLPFIT